MSLTLFALTGANDAPPLFSQNFDKLNEGKPPEDILILNGAFEVKKVEGNALLELAPDPLDGDGILFGPADQTDYTVAAKIQATVTGKRFPEFGIGSCGPGAYKLWLMPATGQLQILKGDEVKASQPYAWTSAQWTHLKLRSGKTAAGKFKLEGKAWPEGKPEPADWQITFEDEEPPSPGRPCAFGTPYSGTPIRFDDITVTR